MKNQNGMTVEQTEPQPMIEGMEKITDVIPIENTPFQAVKVMEKWFMALGKYRLTGLMDSKEQIEIEAKSPEWTTMLTITLVS